MQIEFILITMVYPCKEVVASGKYKYNSLNGPYVGGQITFHNKQILVIKEINCMYKYNK